MTPYAPGQLLPGTKYTVVRKLGEGAMGVVYEASKPPALTVVIKVMNPLLGGDDHWRKRFFAEGKILGQLEHPNIVRIYDYDVLANGTPFIVMERLTGKTLGRAIEEQKTIPPRVAFKIMKQLLSALHCAHTFETPVVHRDVKPENIFLHSPKNSEAVVKLLDFGVGAAANSQTMMAGTPGYASPEQLQSKRISAQTDIYGAAIVLYEMLAGRAPFDIFREAGVDVLVRATIEQPPPPLSRYVKWIPESIENAVAKALDKDPMKRPLSALSFLEMIEALDRDGLVLELIEDVGLPSKPRTEASLTAVARANLVETPVPLPVAAAAPVGEPTMKKTPDTFASQTTGTRRREAAETTKRWMLAGGVSVATILIAMGAYVATRPVAPPVLSPMPPVAATSLPATAGTIPDPEPVPVVAPVVSAVTSVAQKARPVPVPVQGKPAAPKPSAVGSAPKNGPGFEPSIGE